MNSRPVEIVHTSSSDWDRIRRVRLTALRDAPDSFGTRYEDAVALPEATWRERAADPTRRTLLATNRDEHGRSQDLGMVLVASTGDPASAGLYGMWVAPHARGSGIGASLLREALRMASGLGYARMILDVCDHNEPAIRLYEGMGFEPTGRTGHFPPPRTHITEHERARTIVGGHHGHR